jgi:hyperosmotically inducible periplasmic protein
MRISYFIGTGVLAATLLSGSAHAQANTQAPAATDKHALRAEYRQTSKAVRRALTATKGLVSSKIAVLSKGDVVTLVGTVPDNAQIQLAESAATSFPQVHTVRNRLIVKEEGAQ